jgi:hypothetical protein
LPDDPAKYLNGQGNFAAPGGGPPAAHGNEAHTVAFAEDADLGVVAGVLAGHMGDVANPHVVTAAQAGAEAANANIQAHVTGTGAPHTPAGVGAEAAGAVATHAAVTVSVHGFDAAGAAPAQSHDNAKHSTAYATEAARAAMFSGTTKITVAAVAPGGPTAGDLWCDIS